MAALFVRLKVQLIANGLTRSNARLVVGVIGAVAALGAAAAGFVLTASLRDADPATARTVLVLIGGVIVLGWTVLPVLFFGVDDTVDPRRFALLPIPLGTLLTGMFAAGLTGLPAAATAFVALATCIAWSGSPLAAGYALAGAILGVTLCVVASRTVTTAMSGMLRSRKVRDLIFVMGVLLVASVGLVQAGVSAIAQLATRDTIDRIVDVAAWTPLGAPWAAPYDAATGSAYVGLLRLLLVAATVAALLAVWRVGLRKSLEQSPVPASDGHTGQVRGALTPAWATRLAPSTSTGAVAARVLAYWWRDPRQRVALLIIPLVTAVVLVGPFMAGQSGSGFVFAGPIGGTMLGLMMLNHTAYDGTAIWMHIAAGLPGRIDRAGRILGTAIWAIPLSVAYAIGGCLVARRADMLPAAIGATVATVLIGLGVSALANVLFAFPAPPPNANPFTTTGGGNVATVLQQLVGGCAVFLLALPVYGLLIAAVLWNAALGWALLVLAMPYGLLVVRLGSSIGGRYVDEYGPELMRRITPASA